MSSYWKKIWSRFVDHRIGLSASIVVSSFLLIAFIAPFLASSKPIVAVYDGTLYFPLFRYLLFNGFFTKPLDLFFNLLIFTCPIFLLFYFLIPRWHVWIPPFFLIVQTVGFIVVFIGIKDPAGSRELSFQKQEFIQRAFSSGSQKEIANIHSWPFELEYLTPYGKLNLLTYYKKSKIQNQTIVQLTGQENLPTNYHIERMQEDEVLERAKEDQENLSLKSQAESILQKRSWLENESKKIWMIMPFIRPFHWEDDAGGSAKMNHLVPWYELTRTNQKDLTAALIFGVRISIVVGVISIGIALLIGIPIGSLAGYYGGRFDILTSRLLEIWESMPTFFMLLLVIGILQSKSIFLVILVIGLFGWTSFSRFIRGEFFKQKSLPYVEAGKTMGFSDRYLMFAHILPNAIPPVLTLLPFAIMGAITSEAGLSFLGLGEEGSCSWGVLMDEGRQAFPGQSYLLWPPAIMLTTLLVAIALVGDAFRDALDPRSQSR